MKKVVLFIIMFIPLMVNADVQVNNENLKEAYNLFMTDDVDLGENNDFDLVWDFDNKTYSFVDNDTNREYKASYELINQGVNVKFTYNVEKGMTKEEAESSNKNLILSVLMYLFVEKINGIGFEDGSLPAIFSIFGDDITDDDSDIKYLIYDDSDGSTVTCGKNQICVPKSKYGDYAVEIAKNTMKYFVGLNGKTNEDGTITYNYNVKTDTEDKYEIDCMMTINTDGSFEKLKAAIEEQKNKNNEDNKDTGDNKDNNVDNKDTNTSDINESSKDEEVTENPKTGIIDNVLYLMVVMFIVYGLWLGIKNKNIFNKI